MRALARKRISRLTAKVGRRRLGDALYEPPLSHTEAMTIVDERARRRLGMSGEEFLARYRASDLPDTSVVHSLAILAGEVHPESR